MRRWSLLISTLEPTNTQIRMDDADAQPPVWSLVHSEHLVPFGGLVDPI